MREDVIVVGGSFAGLAAALYLARARRTVAVVDTGSPRNRFSRHAHGLLAQDGRPPAAILAEARAQLASYPTVRFVHDAALDAVMADGGFQVTLAGGGQLGGRLLVLAFGVRDELPEIPGLAQRWGRSVLHCPYCHGYEFAGRRLGVLHASPHSLQQVQLIAEWGPTTYFLNGTEVGDETVLAPLCARGIAVEPAAVLALHGSDDSLAGVELVDGRTVAVDALYVAPRTHLNSDLAATLGCALDDGPWGPMVRTDALKATTVPGVFAAGDITRSLHNVTFAAADGVTAGLAAHRALVF
ncbi:MAG: NAD(P)/FAD-dependent oxidoreductase [Vicinamibacterales bacterium]